MAIQKSEGSKFEEPSSVRGFKMLWDECGVARVRTRMRRVFVVGEMDNI